MTLINLANNFCAFSAQKLLERVIQQGPIPKHVAIIMDGNRRFARKNGCETVVEGHRMGGNTLTEILQVFADIGVQEVTVYAFSTENFKRPEQEVKGLMELFTTKTQQWCNDVENTEKKGIKIEVIGDYAKAPTSYLRHLFAKLMWSTKANSKFKLNIAFAYTGQEEVANGINSLVNGLAENEISVDDVDENLLEKAFTLRSSNPVDILIRPGGDERISDFMMWQSGHAYMEFIGDITWPEFNYWHLARAIFRYQMQIVVNGMMASSEDRGNDEQNSCASFSRKKMFLSRKENDKWSNIMAVAAAQAA